MPKAYGGAGVSHVTLTEVVKIVAAADPSLGQLPQNHFGLVDVIALTGTDAQKRHLFSEVLSGKRFGNGFSEKGTKHVLDLKTRVRRDGDDYVVDGTSSIRPARCSRTTCRCSASTTRATRGSRTFASPRRG